MPPNARRRARGDGERQAPRRAKRGGAASTSGQRVAMTAAVSIERQGTCLGWLGSLAQASTIDASRRKRTPEAGTMLQLAVLQGTATRLLGPVQSGSSGSGRENAAQFRCAGADLRQRGIAVRMEKHVLSAEHSDCPAVDGSPRKRGRAAVPRSCPARAVEGLRPPLPRWVKRVRLPLSPMNLFRTLTMRSLQSRILALFLLLMGIVQGGGFVLINTVGMSAARKTVGEALVAGAHVFNRLLEQDTQRIVQGARLMSADYAFREVISTGDRQTIASVLVNYSKRINAAMMMAIDLDQWVVGDTLHVSLGKPFAFPKLIAQAQD